MPGTEKMMTTGQAAKHCSVARDTVLRWIRSGVLPSRRTAGGHHRIDGHDLDRLVPGLAYGGESDDRSPTNRPEIYCWDFHGGSEILEGCRRCPVYRMRAHRCFEVAMLAPEAGHAKLFCKVSCIDCDYYRHVHELSIHVLIVTNDEQLTRSLDREAKGHPLRVIVTEGGYACSSIVGDFRPEFAVVDGSLGSVVTRELCHELVMDPRIPNVRVIVSSTEGEFEAAREEGVFARIGSPFGMADIAECIQLTTRGHTDFT